MRDEALVAVDDIVITLANSAGLYAAGIAASLRLGLRECRGFFAAQDGIEIALLHLFRQPQQDWARRWPEHAITTVGERNRAVHFFPHHRECEQRKALAPEFGRRVELPQSQLACLRLQRSLDLRLEVRSLHAVHFNRDQLAIDELAHRVPQQPDLFRQLEVHTFSPRRVLLAASCLISALESY